jgi:MFS superfamily sulfate permease-like transporter
VEEQMKKQEQKKNSFILTKQGDLNTITNTMFSRRNNKSGEFFKFMGIVIITVAVAIVVGGCLSLAYLAFKMLRRNRETYHQFEEEKRASSDLNNVEHPRINVAEVQ